MKKNPQERKRKPGTRTAFSPRSNCFCCPPPFVIPSPRPLAKSGTSAPRSLPNETSQLKTKRIASEMQRKEEGDWGREEAQEGEGEGCLRAAGRKCRRFTAASVLRLRSHGWSEKQWCLLVVGTRRAGLLIP